MSNFVGSALHRSALNATAALSVGCAIFGVCFALAGLGVDWPLPQSGYDGFRGVVLGGAMIVAGIHSWWRARRALGELARRRRESNAINVYETDPRRALGNPKVQ